MPQFDETNQPKERKPRGKSERTKILEAMKREGKSEEGFYDLMVRKAHDTEDNFSFGEMLKRLSPIPKQTLPKVEFEFDDKAIPAVQAAQVLKASSSGLIAPDIANQFITSIASMLKIEEVTLIRKEIDEIKSILDERNA